VRAVTVQVGRTGKLTPVALLNPVDVRGVTISRATLHNESQARSLGVGEGARVTVERAGDVIPEVAEVLDPADAVFEMPDACPVCGGDVVAEGEHHYCANGTSCPAQLRRSLQHFCSADAMDVEGVGAEVAATLVEEGLVESVADLYDLDESALVALDGWGEQSARNLLAEVEASKDVSLARFVYALGIRHVGTERARRLADAFALADLREADADELRAVEDVGPEVAESVAAFFADERNRRVVDRLLDAGVSPTRAERGDELTGLSLVFTGSVEGWTRDDLSALLERHGARVTSSVSGETDYLVVGENSGTRKREAADEHGVPEMDAERFRAEILAAVTDETSG
jgi:DNA ligase (NAD+)